MGRLRLLPLVLLVLGATSCADASERVALPEGVVMHVDQSRLARDGREVFLRVENSTDQPLRITGFTLTSERLGPLEWTGEVIVRPGLERDLELDLPPARCGGTFVGRVRLTYQLGGTDAVESTATAADRYGAWTLLMDRDCARHTLEEAADLDVGAPTVDSTGEDPVLSVPVTLTPTGRRDDVRFGGFESTPLFRQADGSPVDVDEPLGADGEPFRTRMQVVPARCDPHALAEDKVGRLFGVRVLSDDLPRWTSFHLPLRPSTRTALHDFFQDACGLSD